MFSCCVLLGIVSFGKSCFCFPNFSRTAFISFLLLGGDVSLIIPFFTVLTAEASMSLVLECRISTTGFWISPIFDAIFNRTLSKEPEVSEESSEWYSCMVMLCTRKRWRSCLVMIISSVVSDDSVKYAGEEWRLLGEITGGWRVVGECKLFFFEISFSFFFWTEGAAHKLINGASRLREN